MKHTAYIFILISLLLSSCEKVVEFEIDDTERHIVVNALPCTDSMFFANITYSRFFLDNRPFAAVEGATVTLDVNSTIIASSGRDGANYLFPYCVASGDSLTLHVVVPGHDEITAGTRAVALPNMSDPVAEIDTLQPISMGDISFTLTDAAEHADYYYIYVLERDSGSRWNDWEGRWDTIDTVRHAYFYCLNHEITAPEVNSSEGMMDYFTSLLFTDGNIDGEAYDVTISIPMLKDTAEHPILKDYTLVVESLSGEAHRYIREVAVAQGIGQYFAEPAQIYNNLSSGLGIFAAISRRQYHLTFTFKEQEE